METRAAEPMQVLHPSSQLSKFPSNCQGQPGGRTSSTVVLQSPTCRHRRSEDGRPTGRDDIRAAPNSSQSCMPMQKVGSSCTTGNTTGNTGIPN